MENIKPSFYTVIPAFVRYDRRLTYFEIIFYGEIVAMTSLTGFCYATNNYFQDLFTVSESTIKRALHNLEKTAKISISIDQAKGNERKITIAPPRVKNDPTPRATNGPSINQSSSTLVSSINMHNLNNFGNRSQRFKKQDEKPDVTIAWLDEYMRSIQ